LLVSSTTKTNGIPAPQLSRSCTENLGDHKLLAEPQGGRFDTWLDKQRLAGGATWTAEIEHAIDTSQVVLALVTGLLCLGDLPLRAAPLASQGETGYSPARTFESTAITTANKAVVGCVIDQRPISSF
jgi:hypothetical protein